MECVLVGLVHNFLFSNAHELENVTASQGMITVKVWQGLRVFAGPINRAE
jgi:hypothetical protein